MMGLNRSPELTHTIKISVIDQRVLELNQTYFSMVIYPTPAKANYDPIRTVLASLHYAVVKSIHSF